MIGGTMPDVTPAQLVAIVGALAAVAAALGFDVSTGTLQAIVAGAVALASVLIGSDAHLRGKRVTATHAATVEVYPPAAAGPLDPSDTAAPDDPAPPLRTGRP